ncbi:MAG: sigma-70 family RNA polymerase sigma factor [Candidatus Kapabacteria bacterium]|nr:sigma-70 family RNA polymerase sigma factor [Candidatus Kapabacteria bacterium]
MAIILESDAEILDEYRTGQRDRAVTAFVRRHQRFVYSIAYRHLNHIEDSQDAVQEVFLRATQKLNEFKGESTLQTWLYRITVNVCLNMRRKRRFMSFFAIGEGEGERDVASHQQSPASQAVNSDFETYFKTVLETIPTKQRETFCMRYYDELSYDEISAITGTSEGALKANYHWAVKKIAAAIRTSEYYEEWLDHVK